MASTIGPTILQALAQKGMSEGIQRVGQSDIPVIGNKGDMPQQGTTPQAMGGNPPVGPVPGAVDPAVEEALAKEAEAQRSKDEAELRLKTIEEMLREQRENIQAKTGQGEWI